MKLKLALLVGLFAFGFAMSASAGAVVDNDGDLVPNQFDNCQNFDNGPNDGSNQVDTDIDGYGNACDGDLDNTAAGPNAFLVSGTDFNRFVACFGSAVADCREADFTGDNLIAGTDFNRFVALFGVSMAGNSGLACAGTIPCTP